MKVGVILRVSKPARMGIDDAPLELRFCWVAKSLTPVAFPQAGSARCRDQWRNRQVFAPSRSRERFRGTNRCHRGVTCRFHYVPRAKLSGGGTAAKPLYYTTKSFMVGEG